ncbi:aliphatic sulfonate ABC transporter substrate-binding protein [Starkeya sp. 3C]|uniref:Aliphatic sulfonate ABC transporter substrate-binding protein n=1 Tax=Ancylobacter moscoviensis TaxID=2597768 RepID=A0ABY3DW67_9HYPH|nr:aliphatic sulfonate ABC transporter substrate-binding protein [Ancylobacter moscoviensis]TSJ62879.1 aliphatic sulfonate ABC transporter substrate-binding protein [Ancylobacter moscoviensis]
MTNPFPRSLSRRALLGLAAGAAASAGLLTHLRRAAAQVSDTAPDTVRIGYQRSSTLVALLKANGELEKALEPLGVTVTWHEFTSGLPLLEALNLGKIDLSADVADTVPVFAQAAGAKPVFFAEEAPSPSAQAILVPEGSKIASVADLKGKKVAVTKGAGSHYLLLAALAKAGLAFKDIDPAYLTPADGRAAFVGGNVDAWVAWDPFLATTQAQSKARILADGSNGLASYKRYYLGSEDFTRNGDKVVAVLFDQLKAKGDWVKANPKEAAAQLASLWNIDAAAVEVANGRRSYKVGAVTKDGLAEQQKIADAFLREGLLPKAVDTGAVSIWQPAG